MSNELLAIVILDFGIAYGSFFAAKGISCYRFSQSDRFFFLLIHTLRRSNMTIRIFDYKKLNFMNFWNFANATFA